ncbi:MAG: hypothetical protein ACI85U_003906 [Candidatus Promineifilaceae bacterium]|jgi:hypothetical protein
MAGFRKIRPKRKEEKESVCSAYTVEQYINRQF